MKIKITESQLEELYKSTYNSAAAESVEQGNDELALDFLHHSNEMGIPELNGVYPPDVDNDGDTDADDAKHCTYSDHCDYDMDGFIDDTGNPVRNYDFYGVGDSDMDADGIPDDEDDELSVDRFDIRQRIQSELNTMLNEVGGYDDHNTMASHGSNIHGMLSRTISETIGIMGSFIDHIHNDELSKEQLMVGVSNLTNKFQQDSKLIKDLYGEIYLDDDFKKLIINYTNATIKVIKYFRLLSGFSTGIMDNKPTHLTHGLGMDMTDNELKLKISEKLASLGEYIEHLGEMFNTILRRYKGRLEN